jgi:low affinity Fe/Cu permease
MFDRIAKAGAAVTGSGWFFALNVALAVVWLAAGWWAAWSDTWQLTATTVLTWTTWWQSLLIQASSNRDTKLIMAQLSELGRAVPEAEDIIRE